MTTTDKDAIEAARTAYNALTDAQKTAVGADALAKLQAAEVALAIASLPAADQVTTTDKDAIEAARTAYNALNDAQKTAVGADVLAKLTAAEAALAIACLPAAANVTANDKDAIEAARAKYDALTDAQKTAVGAAALAKLQSAEAALAIASLPAAADVTVNDKDAIEAARTAYNALTDAQKTEVGDAALSKLQVVEVALAIVSLPAATDVTLADKDIIRAARAAYEALTAAQKETFPADVLAKLRAAELALGYEVTVPAGEYITFYQNENLYVEDEDIELYTITGVSDTEATVAELNVAAANTPLLVYNSSDEDKTFLLIPTTDQADDVTPYRGFVGSTDVTTIGASDDTSDKYAFNGLQFVWVKNAMEIGANKCWLEVPKAMSARTINLARRSTTGIDASLVNGEERIVNSDVYDLNGQKVLNPTKKGLYIKNGKKVVIK